MLSGPLPAGDYTFDGHGYQQGNDARLHFDLLLRHPGASDSVIASVDGFRSISDDGGVPSGGVGAAVSLGPVDAKCYDELILRTHYVSGSSPYLEFFAELSIP